MPNSRSAKIKVSEMEYELLLTTRATKEIAARYGGLDNLGDKLMKGENFEQAIDEIIWLITLMANQPILIQNYRNTEDQKPLLTPEEMELFTNPIDLSEYKDAIMDALNKGIKRNVVSEADTKNEAAE